MDPKTKELARVDGCVRVVARVMLAGETPKWAAQKLVDGKSGDLVRDSENRIRYFSTPMRAAEFADRYMPMGVKERGVMAVEIPPAVHIMWEGFPLCRFSNRFPKYWPEGHLWVSKVRRAEATCKYCLDEMDL